MDTFYDNLTVAQLEGMLSQKLSNKDRREAQAALDAKLAAAPAPGAVPAPGAPAPGAVPPPTPAAPTDGGNALTNFLPSAAGVVEDTLSGLGALATSPIETLKGMPQGIVDHYSERYFTPEEGQPWYSDALNTFNADPAGMLMDVLPFAPAVRGVGLLSKAAGANKVGGALSKTANVMDRLDPVNVAGGVVQTGAGRLFNKIDGSPEAAMASHYYGAPVGSQVGNMDQYLSDVGALMDAEMSVKPASQTEWNQRVSDKGAEIGSILEAGPDVNPQTVIGRLEDLKKSPEYAGPNDAPKRAAVDNVIAEIEFQTEAGKTGAILDDSSYAIPGEASTPTGRLSSSRLNDVKSKTQANAKYEVGSASESMAQEASKDAARLLREEVVAANPSAAGPMSEYGAMLRQKDILDRGIAGDVSKVGGGVKGDFMATLINATAPIMTGQNRMTRMNARRGGLLDSLYKSTAPTPTGYVRELGYLADMEPEEEVTIPYRTGRLD